MRQRTVGHAFGAAFLLLAVVASAQEAAEGIISALRDRAVVLDIVARVVEREEVEIWNAASSKVTIPGRPVSIKLVGTNVVVLVQFTPYKRDDGKQMLVAQGQVWVNTKDSGMHYQTTIETIPIGFGERVYYFPLGPRKSDNQARIEIQIELKRYQGDAPAGEAPAADVKATGDAKTPKDAGKPSAPTTESPPKGPVQSKNANTTESPKQPVSPPPDERQAE